MPRSAILPLYLSVLARASGSPLSAVSRVPPERGVRIKRWVGMQRQRLLTRLNPRRAWLPSPGV
jgi:hypothetical protein